MRNSVLVKTLEYTSSLLILGVSWYLQVVCGALLWESRPAVFASCGETGLSRQKMEESGGVCDECRGSAARAESFGCRIQMEQVKLVGETVYL